MKMHTIYTKLYQTERRKKSGYFDKNLLELVKRREKKCVRENKRKRDIGFFFYVYSI